MARATSSQPYKVSLFECEYCKESLRVVALDDGEEVITERATGADHVCWALPEGADLLVLEEEH